jgi:hypothetical protein
MSQKLTLTKREVAEIQHSIFYAERLAHGTAGHNQLMLIASLAKHIGFSVDAYGEIVYPTDQMVALLEEPKR